MLEESALKVLPLAFQLRIPFLDLSPVPELERFDLLDPLLVVLNKVALQFLAL